MDLRTLERLRLAHYRLDAASSPRTLSDAARYIKRWGFCWLFAPRNRSLELPSLFEAVKGRRDVHIDAWDADSDRVWAWKSDLPAARRAYYGKGLAGKPVFISLESLPFALAALGQEDPKWAYLRGALPYDAMRVYEALDRFGAQPTLTLKRNAGFLEARGNSGKSGNARFHRALDELQKQLIAAPMGATQEGLAWPSQIFDLVAHWFPEQAAAARQLDVHTARVALIERYLKTVLAAPPDALARLFAIPRPELHALLAELEQARCVRVQEGWVVVGPSSKRKGQSSKPKNRKLKDRNSKTGIPKSKTA